ncbi:MAG: hypothetical protein MUP71_13300 [Candidatus Aminicenantes bacterium]|nr:hypothetical protein [Candidatus Aminicenantes bacterium]
MLDRSKVYRGFANMDGFLVIHVAVVVKKRPAAARIAQRTRGTIYGRSMGATGHTRQSSMPEQSNGS